MNVIRGPRAGVATIWFVTAAQPLDVLVAEPGHDRGFGRKYLALLDPRLTVTPIGDFPLNRSAPAGPASSTSAVSMVSRWSDGPRGRLRPSQPPDRYLRGIAATTLYAFSSDPVTGFGAFAHWRAGELKRAFSATRFTIIEDIGVPEIFEGDFWAGRHRPEDPETPEDATGTGSPLARGVAMPFVPAELADAAAAGWLGFDPADPGPDIPVSAFAVDGRRASVQGSGGPKRQRSSAAPTTVPPATSIRRLRGPFGAPRRPGGFRRAGRAAADGARSFGAGLRDLGRRAWAKAQKRNRS